MITFIEQATEDKVEGTLRKLDLQQGIVYVGNYYTHLPVSPLEYRETHPTLAEITVVEMETEIRFQIVDDYGKSYVVSATGEDMKHPEVLRELAVCKTLRRKPQMTRERLIEIMKTGDVTEWQGCNALAGLNIIAKYLPNSGIEGAEHDEIFAATISSILEAGLTEEDAVKLRKLNWMIDESSTGLACFV